MINLSPWGAYRKVSIYWRAAASKRSCRMSLLQSSRIRYLTGVSRLLPFRFFVYLSHKRNHILEMRGDCPAWACGIWSWKGKPWNWTVTTRWNGLGRGQFWVHTMTPVSGNRILSGYTFLYMLRQEAIIFLHPLHIFLYLPHVTTGHRENIKKKKDFCFKKIVLAFLLLWGDLTALRWCFFESKGEACPMDTQHPVIKPRL